MNACETGSPPIERSRWRTWIGLVLLVLVVRGGVLASGWKRFEGDPDSYRQLAVNLIEEGTFGYWIESDGQEELNPTAFRPPLYPLVLATVGYTKGVTPLVVAILHLALGLATVLLLYAIARRRLGQGVALIGAALLTLDPILLNQSALVMTETFATFLTMLVWYRLDLDHHRYRPVAMRTAGILLGLAVLCRPTYLIWFGLIALVVLYRSVRQRRWAGWLGLCLGAAVMIAPWCMRNYRQFDQPIIATTHGGYTLWLGNNDSFYQFLREADWGEVWDSAELDARYNAKKVELLHNEVTADRWARQQAMQCIRSQPGMFAYASVVRVGRLWGVMPHRLTTAESNLRRLARYTVGVWYTIVFLLAMTGLIFYRRQLVDTPWIWGLLLCCAFTAVHCFYWSNLRMRAPLMPVVCLAAAAGIGCLLRRLRQDQASQPSPGDVPDEVANRSNEDPLRSAGTDDRQRDGA